MLADNVLTLPPRPTRERDFQTLAIALSELRWQADEIQYTLLDPVRASRIFSQPGYQREHPDVVAAFLRLLKPPEPLRESVKVLAFPELQPA